MSKTWSHSSAPWRNRITGMGSGNRDAPLPEHSFRVELPGHDHWRETISCQAACPVHTDARGYVTAISEGDFERAYIIARGPNPFASVCGRVCAAPCEAACRRGNIDAPVAIRALKRFVTERYGVEADLSSAKGESSFSHRSLGSMRDLRYQPSTRTINDFSYWRRPVASPDRERRQGKRWPSSDRVWRG